MATKRKAWMIQPAKKPVSAVPDALKREVETKASDLIANVLKPKHVRPPQEDEQFNYITDIGTKWYRHYFYFIDTTPAQGRTLSRPRSSRSLQGWSTSVTQSSLSISCGTMESGLGFTTPSPWMRV